MKKRFTLLLLSCIIAGLSFAQTATVPSGSGSGSDPFQISSLENLYWLSQTDSIWNDTCYFTQTADIDASDTKNWDSGSGFTPIGNSTTNFKANYNGKGHKITGLYISRASTEYIGLFGYAYEAKFDSISMLDIDIEGYGEVGGIIGYAYKCSINNCNTTGDIVGNYWGYGGIVGYDEYSKISNSYASVSIKAGDEGGAGGLVGAGAYDTIVYCYAAGNITGNGYRYIGGLVGNSNRAVITYCYATTIVQGNESVGGLLGVNNRCTVTNCYATGNVSGSSYLGGFVGDIYSGTFDSCYWDTLSTGMSVGFAYNSGTFNAVGKATSEMFQANTFDGWDFTNTWNIQENNSYPYLKGIDNLAFAFSDTLDTDFPGSLGTMSNELIALVIANDIDPDNTGATLTARWTNGRSIAVSNYLKVPYQVGSIVNGDTIWGGHSLVCFNYSGYIEISSYEDLKKIGTLYPLNTTYRLTADIDASASATENNGQGFEPILNFSGTFHGGGHTISNLYISRSSNAYIGLFGSTNGAKIDSLSIDKIDISGNYSVGGLVGYNEYTSIEYCSVKGSIIADDDCLGGLVGYNRYSKISNSYALSIIEAGSASYVGGLVGKGVNDTLVNCYAVGNISSEGQYIGGLVGYNYPSQISNCYANTRVSGGSIIGGLVGESINSSYITNSYATGLVSGTSYIGGLIGWLGSSVNSSYWDITSTGRASGCGYRSGTFNAVGKPTGEMLKEATFEGWDFTNTWAINEGESYPYFQAFDNLAVAIPDTLDIEYPNSLDELSAEVIASLTANDIDPDNPEAILVARLLNEKYICDGDYIKLPYQVGSVENGDTLWCSISCVFFNSGNFEIATYEDLLEVGTTHPLNATYRVVADIDASASATENDGEGFLPIGSSSERFTGTFHGGGHTISNLTISRSSTTYVGLFGYASKATIDSIGLESVNISGYQYTGALAGYSYYTAINNCFSTGNVTGSFSYTGGLLGYTSYDTLNNCYAADTISGYQYTGALAGNSSYTEINNCYAAGTVTGSNSCTGGLLGTTSYNTLNNCYATATVTSSSTSTGGLIGNIGSHTTINNCYATGTVTSTGNNTGGLVGRNYTYNTLHNCYATGAVTGTSHIGGLVGYTYTNNKLDSCYAKGTVTSTGQDVGGLVGYIESVDTLDNCYATGTVTSTNQDVGGLVGYAMNKNIIKNCHANNIVSGTSYVGGLLGYGYTYSYIDITNSYSRGKVSGTSYVGGFIGRTYNTNVSYCYSTDTVSATTSYIGGFIGHKGNGTVTNCFWDTESSSQSSATGYASGGTTSITGKTTAEMHDFYMYFNDGWDFMVEDINGTNDNWGYNPEVNDSLPFLAMEGFTHNPPPVLKVDSFTNVGFSNATCNYDIFTGTSTISQYGICWNLTGTPVLTDSMTNEGSASSTGVYTSQMTSLDTNTTYYVRAYSIYQGDTIYSNVVSFLSAHLPEVTTLAVSGITDSTATGRLYISDLGAALPFAHGVCWNTTGSPTLADNYSDEGSVSDTGSYTTAITGLNFLTTYYVRAYVINVVDTVYGDVVSFKSDKKIARMDWENPADIIYGTALSATQLNTTVSYKGATVDGSITYTPAAGEILAAGDGQTLSAVFTPTDTANYASVTATVNIDVIKATLTATTVDTNKVYGEENPVFKIVYTGFVNGEDVSVIDVLPGASCLSTTESDAGKYEITVSGGSDDNYEFAYVSDSLEVTARTLTLSSFTADSKVYDGTTSVSNAGFSDDRISGDELGFTFDAAFSDKNAEANKTVSFSNITISSGADMSNYTLASNTGSATATITTKALTITANDQTKTVNLLFTFEGTEFTTDSLVSGDEASSATITSDGAAADAALGSYNIIISDATGTGLENYTITYNYGMLSVIEQVIPEITWSNPSDITYGTALSSEQLNATTVTTGTFTYTPAEGSILSVGDGQTLSVEFTPDDADNYTSNSKSVIINVNKAALSVTADDIAINYGNTIPELTISYSGFVNSEDESVLDTLPTATCEATTESEAGTYDIVVSGGSDNNYEMSYTNGTLTITPLTSVDIETFANISVYPNPVSSIATIQLNGTDLPANYKITSVTGKTLLIGELVKDKTSINLDELGQGMYILTIYNKKASSSYSLIKK